MIESFEERFFLKIKSLDCRFYFVFFSTIIFGIICHSTRFFDYIYFHDGVWGINAIGATIESGRFSLGITNRIIKFITHGESFQSPVFLGFLTLFFVSLFTYFIVKLIDIKSKILVIFLSIIIISFPFFPSLFNFMYTAPFYAFAMMLSVLSVYLFCNYKYNIQILLISILIAVYSIGIYQAVLPLITSLLIIYLFKTIKEERLDIRFIVYCIFYVVLSIITYIVLAILISKLTEHGLFNYRGISNFGVDSISNIVLKIKSCYICFFCPFLNGKITQVFLNGKLLYIYYISLVLLVYMLIINYYNLFFIKYFIKKLIILLMLLSSFPISINLVFLMIKVDDSFYTFMMMSIVFYVVLFVYNVDLVLRFKMKTISLYFMYIVLFILVITSYTYCRYDNACYMANNFRYNKLKNYYVVMISQIKNTPGYKDELPICYINDYNINDLTYNDFSKLNMLYLDGSSINPNTYVKNLFMNLVLGFTPRVVPESEFKDNEEVINMPHYPDYGSIKVINDTVVVKY